METYQVGNNIPIKAMVKMNTIAPAICVLAIKKVNDPGKFKVLKSFFITANSRWKILNEEEPVSGNILRIRTFIDFLEDYEDEEDFEKDVEKVKKTYKCELKGGNPPLVNMKFETKMDFESTYVLFTTDVTLE